MTEDTVNGAQLLLDEIDLELSKKRLPSSTRLLLKSQRYNLQSTINLREDVKRLKSHDVLQKMSENPKLSFLIIFLGFVLNSMINWAVIRKPILQAIILQLFGVQIPLDAIP